MTWRIGLVGPLPPPAGGMATQTVQLADLLRSEGLRVVLVQTNAPYHPRWVGGVRGVRAGFRFVPYVRRLWRAAGEVDIVHVMANSGLSWHLFAAPAIVIAKLRGRPVLVNYRGGDADRFLARSGSFVRATLRRADAIAVPSGFLQDVFRRHGASARIVPNIVDTARFSPASLPRVADPSWHIVVARNLEAIYDVATALRALAQIRRAIPEARMSVAGSGPELSALQALARDLGVDRAVTFTGRLDRDQMAELYRAANVMLNPSRVDNQPNSLLEALACGLPIVSTNVGGVPFVVAHERTALLVEPGDHAAMADAIVRLRDEPALARSLADAGLAASQQYTWQRVRGLLFGLYEEIAPVTRARVLSAR